MARDRIIDEQGNVTEGGGWWEENSPPVSGPSMPTYGNGGATSNPVTGGITGQGGLGGPPSQWTLESLKAYARSKGVEWSDAQAQYWLDKKAELDARGQQIGDPNYANMRLGLADDWTPNNQRYMGGSGGLDFGSLIQPFTEQFHYADFKAPTVDDLKGDAGFQASLDRARDTLQRSAAAKGSLLSGSTLADLSDRTASMTQDAYANLFGRQLTSYNTNRGNAFDQYKERRANFYQNQDSPYAKLLGLASLQLQDSNAQNANALGWAQLGANTITNGSNAANNNSTSAASATAAGQAGSGNAYTSLFGNLAQIPWYLAANTGRYNTGRNTYVPYGPGY